LLAACGEASGSDPGAGLVIVEDPAASDPDRQNFHDFGRVPDGSVVEHVFRLRNTAGVPAGILRVTPSCGCTVPSLSYERTDGTEVRATQVAAPGEVMLSIPPDTDAELAMRIDTREITTKNTDKLLIVNVTTDAEKSLYLTFEAHINVEKPFAVVPDSINLRNVPVNGGGWDTVDIVKAGDFDHRVVGLREIPAGVSAELRHELKMEHDVWVLTAGFEPPLEEGRHEAALVLDTVDENGRPGAPLEVKLIALAVPDLAADPERLVFRVDTDPSSAAVVVRSLLPGQRLRVTSAELEPAEHGDWLSVSAQPEDTDARGKSASWTITLTWRDRQPPAEDRLRGAAMVTFDDPALAPLAVPYVIHVR
jgi:hypothetical protein